MTESGPEQLEGGRGLWGNFLRHTFGVFREYKIDNKMTPRQIQAAGLATTRSVNRMITDFNKETGRNAPKGIDLNIEDADLLDFIRTRIEKSKGTEAAAKIVPETSDEPVPTTRFISLDGTVKEKSAPKTPLQDALRKSGVIPPKTGRKSPEVPVIEYERKDYKITPGPKKKPEVKIDVSLDPISPPADWKSNEPAKKALGASSAPQGNRWSFRRVLSVLPLPMLGLAASYGVYHFASFFAPTWVAIVEASAFELTYIGLAALEGLDDKQRTRARWVSVGAVTVSIIYNSIAGAAWMDPELLIDLSSFFFWAVAILHGVPLAVLAYFVSDLVLHSEQD